PQADSAVLLSRDSSVLRNSSNLPLLDTVPEVLRSALQVHAHLPYPVAPSPAARAHHPLFPGACCPLIDQAASRRSGDTPVAIKDMQGDFVLPRLKFHRAYTLWRIVRERMVGTYVSLLNDILCILWATCLAQGKGVEPLLRTQHQLLEVAVQVGR